jgi:hypothetical protein
MRTIVSVVVGSAVMIGLAGQARADLIHYTHPHPIAPGVHKGMCYIEGPHVHVYKPHKPVLYVKTRGHYAFIGDPVEFERESPKVLYYGHHPAFWIEGEGPEEHYCYIAGPHYHWYAPPPRFSAKFKVKGGAHWYVAAHPRWYRARWRRYRPVASYYASVRIERPAIVVEPPVGFVGVYYGPRGRGRAYGRVHSDVYIAPPGAVVHVAPPHGAVHVAPPRARVDVRVPGVGVFIGPGHPGPRHRVRVRGPRGRIKVRGPRGRVRVRGGGGVRVRARGGGKIKVRGGGRGRGRGKRR